MFKALLARVTKTGGNAGVTTDNEKRQVIPVPSESKALVVQRMGKSVQRINTQHVIGLHNKIWGDFRNLYGDVSLLQGEVSCGLSGEATGKSGNVTDIIGNISYLPKGDINQSIEKIGNRIP